MARFTGSARADAVALVAATAKTIVQLVAPANHIVALTGYGFGGRGISNTQEPGVVQLVQQSTAGTSAALTPVKKQPSRAETLQTAARDTITVEPTLTDIVRTHTVHPQADLEIRDGFGQELEIEGGGRLGIRATYADIQTVDTYLDFEE